MKIFIVNLKTSQDRRAKIDAQLQNLHISGEFIDAVDGRLLSEQERQRFCQNINYAFLPGEIGCALSHQKIYRRMIDEEIDAAVVLEDDIALTNDFKDVIQNIHIPNHFPAVILLSRSNKYFAKPLSKITETHFLHKTLHATTTHSYIINRKAAHSLLSGLYPVWMVADKWGLFEDLSLITVYSVVPHPVTLSEEAETSTINIPEEAQNIHKKKKELWRSLMSKRPLTAKIKHRYRRGILPLFNKVINQGKGQPSQF